MGLARLTTNLLPHEIRTDRIIRAKKPYAAAAAACLLVGLGGMAMGFSAPYAAITDKNIDEGIKRTEAAGSAYSAQETKYKTKLSESQEKQDKTKLIIAGQEERLNWPRFIEVFTAALPRPGANGNLNERNAKVNPDIPEFDQVRMWQGEGKAGQDAYDWFLRRMSEGVPIERAVEDERSDKPKALAFVNVETVHTRWVTNANAFLQAADDQVQSRYSVAIADWMTENEREKDEAKGGRWKPKAADGGAWVVEIRGWTDHKDGRTFLNQALLRNLQRIDAFAKDENKVGRYIVGVPDPVKGKISHPFIYSVFPPVSDPVPNTFLYIGPGKSYLDGLVPTLAGGGVGPGEGPRPGGPPGGGMSIPGGMMPPSGMPGAEGPPPAEALGPAWSGLGSTGGAATPTAAPPKVEGATRRRYEFVVMFLWREPTPSTPGGTPPPAP